MSGGFPVQAKVIDAAAEPETGIAFSIATLVTSTAEHAEMLAAFEARGFGGADCEFLVIDNSGPRQTSAYAGLNAALAAARGRYVVLVHQDVRPIDDRAALESRLAELERKDPAWAVAGNAGGVAPGVLALRISDPHGRDRRVGELPAKVASLDENLLIVRRSARIGFSREHLSQGRKGMSFAPSEAAFRAKWSRALRPRWMQTTCSLLRLAGGIDQWPGQIAEPVYRRLAKRLPNARGWSAR